MKLRYETGIAALIQFSVVTILFIINSLASIISTCVKHDECFSNTISSLASVVFLAVWLGFVAVIGYAAQDRRSKRLAQMLICFEAINVLISLFDLRHPPNFFGLLTSMIDLALALWVILLAWRLMRADGGRITRSVVPSGHSRARRRPTPKS